MAWVDKVRLKYGPTMSLVDLSSGGVQIEVEDLWLRPGSTVVVEIVGGPSVFAMPARVVRYQVAGIAQSIKYRGALEFRRLLELPDLSKRTARSYHVPNPLHAHARLALALRRLDGVAPGEPRIVGPQAATVAGLTTLGADQMTAALAMLNTPASRRAGVPFARAVSGLFSDVAQGIEQRESPQDLTARIEHRLRRLIPARSIRVTDGSSPERPQHGSDVICFDSPSANDLRASKVLVEFASDAAPQEWEFQLLKTSGHLIGLVNELQERRRLAEESESSRLTDEVKEGWSKLVVRFADGRLLKGFCLDFSPPRGHFHLWPSPASPVEASVLVPMRHLKAIFFVSDFVGDANYREDKTLEGSGHGRRIAVTFLDGEQLVGTTLSSRQDGVGFYVTPSDPKSNNTRIFVMSRAVRKVEFL